jgi:quercetin dioxygenase-like cupin family protein
MVPCVCTNSGPRHLHHDQDEWVYVVNGEFQFEVGDEKRYLGDGESIFLPRNVGHAWACVGGKPGKSSTCINLLVGWRISFVR